MSYVTISRGPSTSGSTATLQVPPAVLSDDIMLLTVYVEADVTVTPPAGFILKQKISHTDNMTWVHVFWKRATGAEADTPISSTLSASTYFETGLIVMRGRKTSGDPIESFSTAASVSTSAVAPSIAATAGADLVQITASYNYVSYTPSAGMTEVYDFGQLIGMAYQANVTEGQTGDRTMGISQSTSNKTILLSLAAPGSVTPPTPTPTSLAERIMAAVVNIGQDIKALGTRITALETSSGIGRQIVVNTAAATIPSNTDYTLHTTASQQLPTAIGNKGIYRIRNQGSNPITITPQSSQTIAESASFVIQPFDSWTFVSDNNTNWGVF